MNVSLETDMTAETTETVVEVLARALFLTNLEKAEKSIEDVREERKAAWNAGKKQYTRQAKQIIRFLDGQGLKIER